MRVLQIPFWGRPTDDCAEARAYGSAFGAAPPAARCVVLADTARRLLRGTAAIALGLAWSVGPMRPTCSGAPTVSLRAAVAQATGTPRLLRSGSMGARAPFRLGTTPPSTMPSS